jgi:peptidoglycan hydrolase CwlO-like protein
MTNQQLILIIVSLLAIIPAGVAFLVLFTRQLEQNTRINAALGGKEDIVRVEQKQKDLAADVVDMQTKFNGLNESFSNLNNKVIARNNRERPHQEKEIKEEPGNGKTTEFTQEELFKYGAVPIPQHEQGTNGGVKKRLIMVPKNL